MKHILIEPIISEKSLTAAQKGEYSFAVSAASSKAVIGQAVKEQFKVDVVSVKTITFKGVATRTGKRRLERIGTPWKKAVIKLKKGQKIELFSINETPQA